MLPKRSERALGHTRWSGHLVQLLPTGSTIGPRLPFPVCWIPLVLVTLLLVSGRSGSFLSAGLFEVFMEEFLGRLYSSLWFVWDTLGVINLILLFVSDVESTAFWVSTGMSFPVVVFDCLGSVLGAVPTSALGCEVGPLDVLQKLSGFSFEGCSRTSGTS